MLFRTLSTVLESFSLRETLLLFAGSSRDCHSKGAAQIVSLTAAKAPYRAIPIFPVPSPFFYFFLFLDEHLLTHAVQQYAGLSISPSCRAPLLDAFCHCRYPNQPTQMLFAFSSLLFESTVSILIRFLSHRCFSSQPR